MIHGELKDAYFDWLCHLVCGDKKYNSLSYSRLLNCLYETEFTYVIDLDENRAQDGIDFRYRFGYENGYSEGEIVRELDTSPCNVLEMMVALAFKGEEQIMDDYDYGDRTGQWFWSMVVSLGLGSMHNSNFRAGYVYRTLDRFLKRDYDPDGKGGLFTIEDCREDLRDVEIWAQFMWYLDTILDIYE